MNLTDLCPLVVFKFVLQILQLHLSTLSIIVSILKNETKSFLGFLWVFLAATNCSEKQWSSVSINISSDFFENVLFISFLCSK